jgi:predicted dehydrogenase
MVGHTFEYSPSVRKVKEIIDSDQLGKINYVSASRLNLGIFQRDINVVWDLAPHDFSIILYLLEKFPESVSCEGTSHYRPDIEDVAISTLKFGDGLAAFVQSSWLDPNKVRQITIVGTRKMLLYDDVSPNEKVKIFDKGVDVPPRYDTFGEFQFAYRYGDIYIPRVEETEPLRLECEHFVECIRTGRRPQTDVDNGTRVVRLLEACELSLRTGRRVNLSEPAVKSTEDLGDSSAVAAIRELSRGVDGTTI